MSMISHKCYGISSYASNGMKSDNPYSGIYEADTSRTLDRMCGYAACNQGGVIVVEILNGEREQNGQMVQDGDEQQSKSLRVRL